MKKVLWFLLMCGMVGCATSTVYQKAAAENRSNLVKLSVGMTKQEALSIMGTASKKGSYAEGYPVVENPTKTDVVQGGGRTFEALYYLTNPLEDRGWWLKSGITYDELTPLLFKDGVLVGWGDQFLQENVPDYELFKYKRFSTEP